MTSTTEHERVVELIRAKTIVPASIARNDAEAERVLAELADAVLAALAVPATGETPVYELFPGTREALDALTIRKDATDE